MKKYLFLSGGVYLFAMLLSFLYCQPNMKELSDLFIHTVIYSAIVLCILVSMIIFVKSDYISILGLIPNKIYLYLGGCFLAFLGFQSFLKVMSTQSIQGASMFLPVILAFSTGCYLKQKFHID